MFSLWHTCNFSLTIFKDFLFSSFFCVHSCMMFCLCCLQCPWVEQATQLDQQAEEVDQNPGGQVQVASQVIPDWGEVSLPQQLLPQHCRGGAAWGVPPAKGTVSLMMMMMLLMIITMMEVMMWLESSSCPRYSVPDDDDDVVNDHYSDGGDDVTGEFLLPKVQCPWWWWWCC